MAVRVRMRVGLVMLATTALLALAGCPDWLGTDTTDTSKPVLRSFSSGSDLLSFFQQQASAQYQTVRSFNSLLGGLGAAPVATDTTATGAEGTSNESTGETTTFSTTNVQEAGVDEADIFKSDGVYFYIAHGNTVRIVRAVPVNGLAEVAQVEFDGPVSEMYLYESKLIVVGLPASASGVPVSDTDIMWASESMSWPPYVSESKVVVSAVDLTDPAAPAKTGKIELDGSLVASRLTGGRLFLVLTIVPDLPANPTPISIAAMTLDQVLPKAAVEGEEQPMVDWSGYYRPDSPDGYYTTAVVTLNAANIEQIVGALAVMANAGTIYASTEALYVTDDEWDTDNGMRETTTIHKFAMDQQTGARYVGSGSVPGRLLNQFSLGEDQGFLRVATHVSNLTLFTGGPVMMGSGVTAVMPAITTTTDSQAATAQAINETETPSAPDQPYNAVFVLAESQGELQVVGSVENIEPGEQLYAARFLGTRGFLVTFRQIDPLFVLDLSQPTKPVVTGRLEIDGYSDYLHPFGNNLLIGVGRSTHATPWGGVVPYGLQLSLFDVSDMANPKLVKQLQLGGYGSYAEASSTHKAFTFMPDLGLLALPAQLYPTDYDPYVSSVYTGPEVDGTLVFRVDAAAGFEQLGHVDSVVHSDIYGISYTSWRRAAFIGQNVYAITPEGVRAAPLSDFTATTKVELAE